MTNSITTFAGTLAFFAILACCGCGGPKVCPSTTLTVVSRGAGKITDPFQSKVYSPKRKDINSGFSKARKKINTRDRGNPFGYDPNYRYPTKKEEKGLFSKKVMKSWKKY
jgi:hypothetical protein